ncbi:unnamed protein product [Clonostachys rhizophaga]|uniref:Heterokaryon incompatibility domain-containing protein n=1 Tax=Clonostachys rhizophaga TaxID=160324 RepID=A0A9N9VGJ2_9HYPO|nr:unnamed protein product [Clonostachys rhizophaga]
MSSRFPCCKTCNSHHGLLPKHPCRFLHEANLDSLKIDATYGEIKLCARDGCYFCSILHDKIATQGISEIEPAIDTKVVFNNRQSHSLRIACGSVEHEIHLLPESAQCIANPYANIDRYADNTKCIIIGSVFATYWLNSCIQYHTACITSAEPWNPSRLVHLKNNHFRVVSPGSPSEGGIKHVPYFALSHCWGGSGVSFTLTKKNYKDLKRGIKIDRLSKTIRDAANVVQSMAYEYLWVDSLCIIQDDDADWKEQAQQMDLVYKHAVLTIAATGSKDETFPLCIPEKFYQDINPEGYRYHQDSFDYYRSVSSKLRQGLEEREQLRSRKNNSTGMLVRVLRTKFFEPPSEIIFDHRLDDWTKGSTALNTSSIGHEMSILSIKRKIWRDIVEDYSGRALTKITDRSIAIHGVTKEVENVFGTRCLFGIRVDDMPFDLLWSIRGRVPDFSTNSIVSPGIRKRVPIEAVPIRSAAPSWSWLSVQGSVEFHALGPGSPSPKIEIPDQEDLMKRSTSCPKSIRLRGRVAQGLE